MSGPARPLAIENVTVIPLDTDRRLEAHTVVVRGDRIAWLGPAEDARVSEGAVRIDGRGKYVIPGLADMHAHPSTQDHLLLYLANGITTVRNMKGAPRHIAWRDGIARGEMLGPSLHTAGPITDGDPTMRVGAVSVSTEAEADRAVSAAARAGYEAIKVYDHLAPQGYQAIVRAATAYGLPVVGHVAFQVGLDAALAARQRSIEHLYGYVEAMQPPGSALREHRVDPASARALIAESAVRTADRSRTRELVDATRAAGTWNCPTLIIRRRHLQTLDELTARPENRYEPPMHVEGWRQFKLTYPYGTSLKGEELAIFQQIVRGLHASGAGLLAGTDASVHFIFHGSSLHEELEEFVAAGLTPYQALVVASRNAAEFLGELDESGTVAAGKRADLLVLSADPTTRITNTRAIEGVMLGGRWLARSDLDALLERVATNARALPQWLSGPASWATEAPPEFAARYELDFGGTPVGAEEVRVERRDDGGRRIRTRAHLATFAGQGWGVWEAGTHHSEFEADAYGCAQTARYESQTADGNSRGLLTREDNAVSVERDEPPIGPSREWHEVGSRDVLLGRAYVGIYLQLADRARDLRVGEATAVELLGPGSPPDGQIFTTTFTLERLADEGGERVYRFDARRRNASYSGRLTCDPIGRLREIAFAGRNMQVSNAAAALSSRDAPAVRIRRVSETAAPRPDIAPASAPAAASVVGSRQGRGRI